MFMSQKFWRMLETKTIGENSDFGDVFDHLCTYIITINIELCHQYTHGLRWSPKRLIKKLYNMIINIIISYRVYMI